MIFRRKLILVCCFSILSVAMSYAQPCVPGDPGCDPGGGEPVPISGIEILLVAGGALGVKRILGLVKKSNNQ
jgi:hypothetical protein